ncbi:hypothetical protein IPZ58_12395 [Streptomyces roseoverticillatus]|uniref:hypothetical protein n=1 Tax=Streptomyces roseoverticillatus TaxID=66429 RepID=UPI001F236BD4|nr:hypothetical protein [Streptomyces roseoverticillatus]MCF3102378.1 hypothetical protein [Streptomyces roseoverticillatus]
MGQIAWVVGTRIIDVVPDPAWQRTRGVIDAGMVLEFVCVRLARLPGGTAALALALAADGLGVSGRSRVEPDDQRGGGDSASAEPLRPSVTFSCRDPSGR